MHLENSEIAIFILLLFLYILGICFGWVKSSQINKGKIRKKIFILKKGVHYRILYKDKNCTLIERTNGADERYFISSNILIGSLRPNDIVHKITERHECSLNGIDWKDVILLDKLNKSGGLLVKK